MLALKDVVELPEQEIKRIEEAILSLPDRATERAQACL